MSDDTNRTAFSGLLEAMPDIAAAVNAFEGEAVRLEALRALVRSREIDAVVPASRGAAPKNAASSAPAEDDKPAARNGTASPRKRKKRGTPKQVPGFNPTPAGKTSLADFVAGKRTKSHADRTTLIVYWLQHEVGTTGIGVDDVYTAYRALSWKVPASLDNALQVTKSKYGWIETADMSDIKMTIIGDNQVEHSMDQPVETSS